MSIQSKIIIELIIFYSIAITFAYFCKKDDVTRLKRIFKTANDEVEKWKNIWEHDCSVYQHEIDELKHEIKRYKDYTNHLNNLILQEESNMREKGLKPKFVDIVKIQNQIIWGIEGHTPTTFFDCYEDFSEKELLEISKRNAIKITELMEELQVIK